jgi:predicted O-linked N-acetylglucosamine transferase (SPINDLY family)
MSGTPVNVNQYSAILINKAENLQDAGHLQEACALLEEVVALEPLHVKAHAALGKLYGHMQDHQKAIAHLEHVQKLDEDELETGFTLGYEYCQVGRYTEAIACFDGILRHAPQLPALHRWRGFALGQLGRGEEAWHEYQEALRLEPNYHEVLAGLANLLFLNRHIEEAETYLLKALSLSPDSSAYHNDLGRVYRQQGRMEEAVACYRKALELEPGNLAAVSNILYGLCYVDHISPEDCANEHRLFAGRYYAIPANRPVQRKTRMPDKPINVGYVSSDFGTHSVSYFLEPVLIHHDLRRVKVFCYSNRGVPDETTHRIKGLGVVWRDIMGVSAEDVAAMMAVDGIDILVDLSGHSAGHRLDIMALKPAAVQASWIGYPHTTGLSQIDYYISDNLCDPPGMTDHLYSEKVWRLPRIFSCYLPPMEFPIVTDSPLLNDNCITFCSFNNFAKVNEFTIELWATILRNVPNSRFVLKSAALGGSTLQEAVCRQFAQHAINPERIVLLPFAASTMEHLAHYNQVNIALDTFPYHGTTTTCEALWMGVPVVTLAGSSHLSRVGVSFLHSVGLGDLVAETPHEYVACATRLAFDSHRLMHLRSRLRLMIAQSPLMDAAGVTREVEEAYLQMVLAGGNIEYP